MRPIRENKVAILTPTFIVASLLVGLIGIGILSSQVTGNPAPKIDVLIGFTHTPGPSERALVKSHGGSIKYSYHLVPAIAASVPESAIAGLSKNPRITNIDLDGTVHAIDHPTGDVELDSAWGVAHIGAGTVHLGGNKGTGVKVAVIDTGIDYTHTDLAANYAGGHDFVNNDTDPMDDHYHGTHVAGTVAAVDDNAGVVGVAPEARLYALKILNASGSGSFSDVIAALQWAVDNEIQVTNNSYGSSQNPGGTVQAAFDNSAAAGVLHIAAAGNSGNPRGKGNNVIYPARYDSVVAVAATDGNDNRAWFSSTGDTVELAAPGVGINSTKPGGVYGTLNGTSMACPHVAGMAALVIAAGYADVRTQLQTTADDLGDAGRDPQYGFGLVDADEAAAAVGPPIPAVNVSLNTDKTDYVSGVDTTAVLTAVVKDEMGTAISGLASSVFVTTLNVSGVSVTFTETATVGTYIGNLDLSGRPDDTYTVEVTVTDTRLISGSDTAIFTIGPAPTGATNVIVDSITYDSEGGRNGDKHLLITVALVDNLANAVGGASVSIELRRDGSLVGSGTATTGTEGTVTFTLKNARSGRYTTNVTDVNAAGLTWDGVTPDNGFDKP